MHIRSPARRDRVNVASTSRGASAVWRAAAALVVLAGCGSPSGLDENVPPALSGLVVSNPVRWPVSTGHGVTPLPGPLVTFVYVSLPPGAVRDGQTSTIRNLRTAKSTIAMVVDGGFDPVAVDGRANDTLEVDVQGPFIETLHAAYLVPAARPPVVIRSTPVSDARDVPLNATMSIVFSEPMDSATLAGGAVRLEGTTTGGGITFVDTNQVSVRFTPSVDLAPHAAYALVVTQESRDLDGDPLQASVSVAFTTAEPPPPGLIAFVSVRDGNREIYDMNAGGWRVTRLTNDPQADDGTAWSPDGSRIAFASTRDGHWQIYLVNADGSGLRRVTNDSVDYGRPAWSPDGTRLTFAGSYYDDSTHAFIDGIYVTTTDGSGLARITDGGDAPTWSPDGTRIAFWEYSDSQPDASHIFVVNADGSGLTPLTHDSTLDTGPIWSPDGTKIVFTRPVHENQDPRFGRPQTWIMNADGTNLVRIVGSATQGDTDPIWSPDGARIAFQRGSEIYAMNADGSGQTRLTPNGQLGWDSSAVWSPDALHLVFVHNGDIYIMRPDGTNRTQLTSDSLSAAPVWSRPISASTTRQR
jgi:Tol biopolymer transport system component